MTAPDIADGLADGIQAVSLSDTEHLLFRPKDKKAELAKGFDDIPRYLFRVFSPNSNCTTDRFWVRSNDAHEDFTHGTTDSREDIFARENDSQTADMLNKHLRWKGGPDNFVSWTSSLLDALLYIFYRHDHAQDGSAFKDISICIIDTTMFEKGVFLRDMDLIETFHKLDSTKGRDNLENFKRLRSREGYYFGEYLSQGALKIEGKCQIVTAQAIGIHESAETDGAIANDGLFKLYDEFKEFADAKPRNGPLWARRVISFRNKVYLSKGPRIGKEEVQAAVKIAELFGGRWALPVAANLMALFPCPDDDSTIIEAFRAAPFTDDDRANCSPLKTKVMVYEHLAEVEQFRRIMRSIYKDHLAEEIRRCDREEELERGRGLMFVGN